MDIRSFFPGGAGRGRKSALTEVRETKGSPSKKEKKSSESVPKRKVVEFSDKSSDDESPIPRSLRGEAKKGSKRRKVVISSDEDELPPSASQARPPKRSEKISPSGRSGTKGKEEEEVQIMDVESPKRSTKRQLVKTPEKSPKKLKKASAEEASDVESDEFSDFVPAKKAKRGRTPPGQSKLQFEKAKKTEKETKKSPIKRPVVQQVDPAEFFNNFGKTAAEIKEGEKEKKGREITERKGVTEAKKKKEGKESAMVVEGSSVVEERRTSPRKASTKKEEAVKKSPVKKTEPRSSVIEIPVKEVDVPAEDVGKSKAKSPKTPPSKASRKQKEEETEARDLPASTLSPRRSAASVKKTESPKKISPSKVKEVAKSVPKDEPPTKAPAAAPTTARVAKVRSPKTKVVEERKVDVPSAPVRASSATGTDNLPWVDKYKPTNLKHLVGQHGEKSPMNKLLGWLRDWPKYHLGEGAKQKKPRPAPWMAQSDGTSFKAALLSGPPGIGKTTCAILACQELNLQCVEMNASDARNKRLLDDKVAELLGSRQIVQFFGKSANINAARDPTKLTHVLIMDEVDGMSGNEDRAGLAELIQMIKETKIPIVCICNDRQSSKMRTLVNYCFDLRFPRPRVEQIRPRIQTIAFQEKLKLTKEEIDEIIESSNHDVRQTIYNLQLLGGGAPKNIQKKDVAVNTFEAARVLLNAGADLLEKQRMFFVDYSIMPLFVHENYPLLVSSNMSKKERLNALQKAAESISNGDLIDRTIRGSGAWSLLNEQGLFSSVMPSMYMNGYLRSMINFPSWLGKNSSTNKHHRLLRQLEAHTFLKISSDCHSLVTEYVPILRDALYLPLVKKENDGIPEVMKTFDEYDLTREDSEEIADLGTWPDMDDYRKKVATKVKSALTRAVNKHSHLLPYALDEVSKKRGRGAAAAEPEFEVDEEGNLIEVGGGDGLNDDDENGSSDDAPAVAVTTNAKPTASAGRGGRSGGRGGRGGARGGGAKPERGRGRGRGR